MDAKTLEALKASIAKWEMNVETAKDGLQTGNPIRWSPYGAAEGVIGLGPKACPLCRMFFKEYCHGCPVTLATGIKFCTDTPYPSVSDATPDHKDDFLSSAELVAACEAEVAFLRSLLPAEA